jgi:hypothetical protein
MLSLFLVAILGAVSVNCAPAISLPSPAVTQQLSPPPVCKPTCPCLACQLYAPDAPRLFVQGHADGAGSGLEDLWGAVVVANAMDWFGFGEVAMGFFTYNFMYIGTLAAN